MELLNDLAQSSILGLLLTICIVAIIYLYKDMQSSEKEYQIKLENTQQRLEEEKEAHLNYAKK